LQAVKWVPDGGSLLYQTAAELRIIDASASASPVVIDASGAVSWFGSSPDSRFIEYRVDLGGYKYALHLASRSGSTVQDYLLVDGTSSAVSQQGFVQAWTTDGARFAFGNQAKELYVVDTSSAAPGMPVKIGDGVSAFAWSQDGTYLAYGETGVGVFVRDIANAGDEISVAAIAATKDVAQMWWSKTNRFAFMVMDDSLSGTFEMATVYPSSVDVKKLGGGGGVQYVW
jgi:hypothetical protein